MKTSTVIPVYNRSGLIDRCVRSALACGRGDHEVVVVDNQSTDGTWDVVCKLAREHPEIRCFQNATNVGPVRNWLRGVSEARGEYCNILFSDDTVHPDFLLETLPLMRDDTGFAMTGYEICSRSRQFLEWSCGDRTSLTKEEFYSYALLYNPSHMPTISPGNALFRTTELQTAILPNVPNTEGLDMSQHGAGPDQLIFLICSTKYPRIRISPHVLATYLHHEGSITVATKDLSIPREWARWYFVHTFLPSWSGRYKTSLWLRKVRQAKYLPLYHDVCQKSQQRLSPLFAARLLLARAIHQAIRV